jgi:Fic family protein
LDIGDFSPRKPGQLVLIPEGGYAFVPDPLPPRANLLTTDVVLALSEAEAELGRLDGVASNLPNPEIVIAPFLRKEAVLSSRIEGTQTTYSGLLLFEAGEEKPNNADAREVANYVRALRHGLAVATELPISRRLITDIHGSLMQGVREAFTRPGEFRDRQVYIAPAGAPIGQARYVPPPVAAVDECFSQFEKYIHSDDMMPLLIRLAVVHYQFEAIHPFNDGNGRIGRLLIPLMLCMKRRLSAPMLYISAYFEQHRSRYYDLLLDVSKNGNWQNWIVFFLKGIRRQARDAIMRSRQLLALRDSYRARLTTSRGSSKTLMLLDEIFVSPVITSAHAARTLSLTWPSAKDNILKLVDAGVLSKLDLSGKSTFYIAHRIIEIIDKVEALPEDDIDTRSEQGSAAVTTSSVMD